jgi:hypothetical protein
MVERLPGNWWVENLLRPVLIAAMMACLAAPLVAILEWLLPGWDGTYFLVFCFLAGLEGILSERALRRQRISGWGYLGSRSAEFLILVLLLKLANYIPLGFGQLWADARAWPADPGKFWTPADMLTILILLPLWVGALMVARQASELDADEGITPAPPDKTSAEYYLWLTQPPPVRMRQEALNWLGEMFLWGGIGLLVASAVLYVLLPAAPPSVLPTLIYFALGVALLSQARFSVTRAGWQVQGIAVQHSIGRRWLVWAIIFLVFVALVAMILPTEYTMGPLLTLLYVFGLITQVVVALISLIPYLLAVLVSLLFPGMQQPTGPPPRLEPMMPPEPATATASPPWVEILLSALFWLLILSIVGYAIIRFVRDRLDLFAAEEGPEGGWRGRLLAWLRAIWVLWTDWRHGIGESLARRRPRRASPLTLAPSASRFLSLRRLPPRELIRYFYLSTAKRAAHAGQPRLPGQTPYEYQASLDGRFPDLEPDLTGLTDAFIQARYSPQPVYRADAETVKPFWQRIKAALRRRTDR